MIGGLICVVAVFMTGCSAEAKKPVTLVCEVIDADGHASAEFRSGFCEALRSALADGIKRPVSLGRGSDGDGLEVRLTVRNPNSADVELKSGHFQGPRFVVQKADTSTLNSVDAELRPAAAKTLVFPIAKLLE